MTVKLSIIALRWGSTHCAVYWSEDIGHRMHTYLHSRTYSVHGDRLMPFWNRFVECCAFFKRVEVLMHDNGISYLIMGYHTQREPN